MISSGRIYYVFEIKVGSFRKRYLSCELSLLGKTFVRVRLFEKTFIHLLSIMPFLINVEIQRQRTRQRMTRQTKLLSKELKS